MLINFFIASFEIKNISPCLRGYVLSPPKAGNYHGGTEMCVSVNACITH